MNVAQHEMELSRAHLHAGYRAFGLRRVRALCSCGHQTRPQEDEPAALMVLLQEHGAVEPPPGVPAWIEY